VLLTGIELNETGILPLDVDGGSASIFLCDVNADCQDIIVVPGQLDLLETKKRALT